LNDLNEGQDPPEAEREEDPRELAADDNDADDGPDPDEDDDGEEIADDDDGDDDDDETPAGDEEQDEPVRQVRQPSRGQRDFGALRKQRREAEQRAHELELENIRLRQGAGRTNEPEPQAVRNARLAAMEPEERTAFMLDEMRVEMRNNAAREAFRSADREDYNKFQERAARNPTYAKHAAAVERRLELLRAQGQNVPRESILKFIIGERVLGGRVSPKTKQQRDAAQQRVRNERVSLPNSKGARGGSRSGSKSADLEKRLANVPI
jgi:hypothetical protein